MRGISKRYGSSNTADISTTLSQDDKRSKKPTRKTWSHPCDIILTLIGYHVAYGNVWRFPYLCYRNGGGVFFISYVICVAIGSFPLYFMELSLGQMTSKGFLKAWGICPLFEGIGMSSAVILLLTQPYYILLFAISIYYLVSSLTSTLPWSTCGNDWNTDLCRNFVGKDILNVTVRTNTSSGPFDVLPFYESATNTTSGNMTTNILKYTDPATEFWEKKVLAISAGIEHMGYVKWDLALCLLLSWGLVFLCICKGIRVSAKIMYITATAPYVLLVALLIRGLTLPGSMDGIMYYVLPQWHHLLGLQIWWDAGSQVFYTQAICLGSVIALGSLNEAGRNCLRDSILVTAVNGLSSVLAGFTIFATLGFMAYEQNTDVGEVADSGPSLVFIAYPSALAMMPIAPLWACIFFTMLIFTGMDSTFVMTELFISTITDEYREFFQKSRRRVAFTAIICAFFFICGLPFVTSGGIFLFQLFDYYLYTNAVTLIGICECIVIGWVYGAQRYQESFKFMTGINPGFFFTICWKFITPCYLLVLCAVGFSRYSLLTYGDAYQYPWWANMIGWSMAVISLGMVPGVLIYNILKTPGSFGQRLRVLTTPQIQLGGRQMEQDGTVTDAAMELKE